MFIFYLSVLDSGNNIYKSLTGQVSRYHFSNMLDDSDDGVIRTITFNKEYSDSDLRMTSSGTHSIQPINGTDSKCAKW